MYGVQENPDLKVFDKPRHLTYQKHVNYLPWTHNKVTQLCMIFLMYEATIQHSNHSRQESKQKSKKHHLQLQFISLIHLWPWNKVKVIEPAMKMYTLSKVIIMQSSKDLTVTVLTKRAMFFSQQRNVSIISLARAKIKNSGIFLIYLM